ncbi:hypothetical protein DM02DRAFT_657010 [Periconia macrospinosa]|uniref:Uncharacterized protein n=1 Tax=Periconia macrospinosa TaxID=97972 RepID=A0A2V1DND6_9PLEO|nr:hypothetical protein DM02DRAFT_657010 [Periconia macrospinosa]
MSSTSLSTTPSATTSANAACATQNLSDFPTQDNGCAVGGHNGLPSAYNDALKKCCKSAPVESWANNCSAYCLAVDQSVADLIKCYQDNGVNAGEIFCRGNNTATATGKPSQASSSSGGNGQPSSTSAGGQGNGGGNGGGNGQNGAVAVGVSKAGLGMVAMVFVSAIFGMVL